MSIERIDGQQTTCGAYATVNGERRQVAMATCMIRPGRSMTFNVEIPEGSETLSAEDAREITGMYAGYLAAEIGKARALGILLDLPPGGDA